MEKKREVEAFPNPVLLMKLIPFSTTNRREKNYKQTFTSPYGTINVMSVETLNAFDLKVFSAVHKTVVDGKVYEAGSIDRYGKIICLKISLYELITKYMHKQPSGNLYKQVSRSIVRLTFFGFSVENTKTEVNMKTFRFFYASEIEKNTLFLYFPEAYVRVLNALEDRIRIFNASNYYIQKLRGNTAVVLAYFLMSEPIEKTYSRKFLLETIHLDKLKSFKANELLKEAFSELKEVGFIIKLEKCEKEGKIYYKLRKAGELDKLKHKLVIPKAKKGYVIRIPKRDKQV